MKIPFVKYQGAGNDFILIDLRKSPSFPDPAAFAVRVCERRFGIGADGFLLLLPSKSADYRMRIFNADGSEPSMCGNGLRCLVDFIVKSENVVNVSIETLHGVLKCRKVEDEIAVNLGPPAILHWPCEMADGSVFIVNTGVPHAVLFVDNLESVDVASLGRKIRFDSRFAPQGVNVNFVCPTAEGRLALRTYERGVEAETLACGTGAAAAAFVASEHLGFGSQVPTMTRCSFGPGKIQFQQLIRFLFPQNSRGQTEIEMLGSAEEVFSGTIVI